MPNNELKAMPDNRLAILAKNNEAAYSELISRYLFTVRRLAGVYTSNPSDFDDLVSEGILGLMSAVREFDGGVKSSFSTFAGVCISNRMLNCLKRQGRISGHEEGLKDYEIPANSTPESILLSREELGEVFASIAGELSGVESKVFGLYCRGLEIAEIAKKLEISKKSAGNALFRVRTKLRKRFR